MGASGGIVGIQLLAPADEQIHALETLHRIVPQVIFTRDNYHEEANNVEELPGFLYGSYGTSQDWDLGCLPEMVEEAEEYAELHPKATFEEWLEEIYLTEVPYQSWTWSLSSIPSTGMRRLLAHLFLGCPVVPYSFRRTQSWYFAPGKSPGFEGYREFLDHNVGSWTRIIRSILNLNNIEYEETWT